MLESRESQTVLDDERSNEIGNEGGASGLVFFGMQVELAFSAMDLLYLAITILVSPRFLCRLTALIILL